MRERRFDDTDADAILRAAAAGTPDPREAEEPSEGFTLSQLVEIGRDVGIPEGAVVRAAATVELREGTSRATIFGLPIAISRTIELRHLLSDGDWDRLVARSKEVFEAEGTTRSEGAVRQWRNGNLSVVIEPGSFGHRLRFRTVNATARASIQLGVAALGVTGAAALATALAGNLVHAAPGVAMMGLIGVGMIAYGALRLPAWARLRARQMEVLAVQASVCSDSVLRGD